MSRIISWSLYINSKYIHRLGEYLFGLKCNIQAAKKWVPTFKCRLYYHSSVQDNLNIWQYVVDLCKDVEMIKVREGYPTETERYRPLFEDHEVTIVRDIDSILSKTDADYVNEWLQSSSKIFYYSEYMMDHKPMGGGVGVKGKLLNEALYIKPVRYNRGDDEDVLANILDLEKDKLIIYTRMSDNGVYYTYPELMLLWTVPFYDALSGMLYNYDGCENLEHDVDQILNYVIENNIKDEHINAHDYHFDIDWIR